MNKTPVMLLVLVLGISFTAAFAYSPEFQNKELNTSLSGGRQLHLQFTDESYPMIDNGYVVGTTGFSLVATPIKIYQNGFLLTVPDEGWFLTGAKTKTGNYSIELSEWTGKQFVTTQFDAGLQDIGTSAAPDDSAMPSSVVEDGFALTGIPPEQKKDLVILVEQDMRNYWKDNYDVDVKVFDKKLNPNPKFLDTVGAINNATVKVTLIPQDGSTHDIISGQTSKIGLWNGNYLIPDNKKIGMYNVHVQVDYRGSNAEKILQMFVFGLG